MLKYEIYAINLWALEVLKAYRQKIKSSKKKKSPAG